MERKQCLYFTLSGNPFLVTSAVYKDHAAEGNSKVLLLEQNSPNPFSENTTINCFIPANSINAELLFFDMQGNLVKTFNIPERLQTSLIIPSVELRPGIYIYSLVINNKEIDSKRMIITK